MNPHYDVTDDINAVQELTKRINYYQIQFLQLVKELGDLSPAAALTYCNDMKSRDELRRISNEKLFALASAGQAVPMLNVKMDGFAMKMVDQVHEHMSPETLMFASEYLNVGRR